MSDSSDTNDLLVMSNTVTVTAFPESEETKELISDIDLLYNQAATSTSRYLDHTTEAYLYESNDGLWEHTSKYNYYAKQYENKYQQMSEKMLPSFLDATELKSWQHTEQYAVRYDLDIFNKFNFFDNNQSNKVSTIYFTNEVSQLNPIDIKYPLEIKLKYDLEPLLSSGLVKLYQEQGNNEYLGHYYNIMARYLSKITSESADVLGGISSRQLLSKGFLKKSKQKEILLSELLRPVTNLRFQLENRYRTEFTFQYNLDGVEANEDAEDILRGFIKRLAEPHRYLRRTLEGIFKGQCAKSEPLLYEIQKLNQTGQLLTSFYIPALINVGTEDVPTELIYNDTQVKYGKKYTYRLISHQLIYGNTYMYSGPFEDISLDSTRAQLEAGTFGYKLDVDNQMDCRIVPIILHESTNVVLGSPPVPPKISFLPYKNDSQNIRFLLEKQNTQQKYLAENYIGITEQEEDAVQLIKEQFTEPDSKGDFLIFDSDDSIAFFEIFRLAVPPASYLDFKDSMIQKVSTLFPEFLSNANSLLYKDSVIPDTDYYYTFRAVDVHGHISCFTSVYKMRISMSGTAHSVSFQSYNMQTKLPVYNKTFKKTFSIKPQYGQIGFDEQEIEDKIESGEYNSATDALNIEKDRISALPIWNRQYVIRLKSTTTGRRINIRFKPKFN